ncbi:hypothetical protein AQUCO_01800184v1 [Aquilegia coerulea]|uniref:Uncharacterized protein n=1 Tax=Aquilegia coerulea TaxID=218851 RepID=A0A2G5DKA9_AQUCA|nr:hypothetical protein AQUCO_01800184v1 [Aquilegia coerulea]
MLRNSHRCVENENCEYKLTQQHIDTSQGKLLPLHKDQPSFASRCELHRFTYNTEDLFRQSRKSALLQVLIGLFSVAANTKLRKISSASGKS